MPSVDEDLAEYALRHLRKRGIDVRLETRLDSAEDGHVVLSDGTEVDTDTLVWVAGVRPNPTAGKLGLPVDAKGRIPVDACLRVLDTEGAWAAGDCAAVPDLIRGGTAPPSGQYALREARRLGANLVATIRGEELKPFSYRRIGETISLGRHQGVAEIFGIELHGFLAWTARRFYHIARIPSVNRKLRVWLDWTVALGFERDITALGSEQHPRAAIEAAAREA
jgi:NADH dehydrogenase